MPRERHLTGRANWKDSKEPPLLHRSAVESKPSFFSYTNYEKVNKKMSCAQVGPQIVFENLEHAHSVMSLLIRRQLNTVNFGYLRVEVHLKLLTAHSKFSCCRKFTFRYQ